MNVQGLADVAVIELERDVPSDVGFARFSRPARRLDGHPLMVFGIRAGECKGNYVEARFMGATDVAEVQIDGTSMTGVFVQGGYSGAAVWDMIEKAVLGMVSSRRTNAVDRVAYMIPVAAVGEVWSRVSQDVSA
jgi:hypothetical protein